MRRGPPNETIAVQGTEVERQPRPATLPFARSAGEGGAGGIPCVALGRVPMAMDTLAWRMGSSLRLTVVVKAQFSVDPLADPAAGPIAPVPTGAAARFFPADVHARNQPMAHVTAASDRVPWKKNVDVTLIGQAQAPFGRPVPEGALRFAVREEGVVHLQKRARVLGKRARVGAPPEPFVTMPVIYERAHGGPATPMNPIGTGDDEDDPPPNIVDPDDPTRPVVFGPVAAGWPIRGRKLGRLKRPELDLPVLSLPQDFDVSYFQSAPPDQQFPVLGPTATLILEGFHAARPRVEIALPRARVVGALWGLAAESPSVSVPLVFRMDTLHLDADAWSATVVWRAYVDVPSEDALSRMIVAVGLGMDGEVVPLPEQRPAPESGLVRGGLRPPPTRVATGTLEIGAVAGPGAQALPFWSEPAAHLGATIALPTPAASELLPFAVAVPRLPVPPAPPPPVHAIPVDEAPPPAPLAPSPPALFTPPVAPSPAPVEPLPSPVLGDPYAQASPWARGAEGGTTGAPAPEKPRARPERKFTLRKGFTKR